MKFISKTPEETEKIGGEVVKRYRAPCIFCLFGELGSGKTTFIRGAGNYLGVKKIRSPTFLYVFIHRLPDINFYHIDLYRIKRPEDWNALGFDEYLNDKKGLIFVEWADRIKKIIPERRVDVIFEVIDEKRRRIIIKERSP